MNVRYIEQIILASNHGNYNYVGSLVCAVQIERKKLEVQKAKLQCHEPNYLRSTDKIVSSVNLNSAWCISGIQWICLSYCTTMMSLTINMKKTMKIQGLLAP